VGESGHKNPREATIAKIAHETSRSLSLTFCGFHPKRLRRP
jgi:hypothetical protein